MNKSLPNDWVSNIFDNIEKFYGERWCNQFFSKEVIDLYKIMWFNGLNGLSYEQIRQGLAVSKKYSLFSQNKPPTVVKFFHYCVGLKVPHVPRRTLKPAHNPSRATLLVKK
jgi:hypothetical protein